MIILKRIDMLSFDKKDKNKLISAQRAHCLTLDDGSMYICNNPSYYKTIIASIKAKFRTHEVRFAKAETHVNGSGVSDRLELKEFQDRLADEAIRPFKNHFQTSFQRKEVINGKH